jgi:glutamate carboxypeptidase
MMPPRADVAGDLAATRIAGDSALLHAAQERTPAFLRDLAALVNIDSGTDDAAGLDRVSELLSARLKELGATVEVRSAPPSAGKIVRGIFDGTGSARVLLMIHYDTVFGKGEAQRRPMKIDGNKAFGPGVADAKGGVAIILHALAIARQRGLHDYRTLTVLFTPDEEKGSLGSHEIIASLSAQQDWVLSYEPPDEERVIVGTKGIAHVQMDVIGRASHAGTAPEKGRNAVTEVAAQILQLDHLEDPAKGTTVNWTRIHGGEQINVIPDKASAVADMRLTDTTEIARVQRDAERIVQKHLVPDTKVTVKVERRRPPFRDNPSTDRLAALARRVYQELGKQTRAGHHELRHRRRLRLSSR